ncbi:conserved hypothetical protein [Haloferula helveola]|uniref:LTD domain-containing protein n=1 Tax=Haloferula helveola TaxID=490095 RepID=A0ABM7RH40_9BACT|nr:conserved hypothetical protein [Haloferula helveola]
MTPPSRSILGFLLAASAAGAVPILIESGDLQAEINAHPIPSAASSDKYRLPTNQEMTAFRAALQHILDGDLQAAADAAVDANYDVVSYTDNVSSDVFALLREKNSNQHWGGFYAIDLTPERELVVQCPHPLYDGVRVPATDLFFDTNAVGFLLAGTHRNNSPTESNCDGDLGGDPYRISDMAHAPESLFQAAHEVIEAHFDTTVSLSFHGMAEGTDPADVSISNGTPTEFIGNSLSRSLATRMNEILGAAMDSRVAVSHQEPGQDPALSGSTNTQGRVTNGSTEPCQTPALFAIFPERFIHMECDPDVRDGDPANWAFIIQTLNEQVPLFSDPDADLPTGDLVITEILPNPDQVGDGTGEFIELFNHTGAPIDMTNWTIGDRGGNTATFSGIVQPGDLFVVGVSGDLNGGEPGGTPDAVWTDDIGDLTITNTSDAIFILDADGDLVCRVAYEDGDPYGVGVALEIATGNAHPNGQTVDTDYVESLTPFGTDFASPGTRGESQFPLPDCRLDPTLNGNDIELLFPTGRAITYVLWESPDLSGWNLAPGESPVIGDGMAASFLVPADEPANFFRLDFDYVAP